MDVSRKRLIGVVFVFLGAGFWGVGGTAADFLFSNENINVNWYVSTRLVISGLLLLAIQRFLKRKESIFAIWKNREMRWSLIIFSLVGMLLVQYSYMASIEMGNAAVATLLQYLAPVYIILWLLFRKQAKLTMGDVIAVFLTVVGTWLLLTNGSFQGLSVPVPAVVWGIVSGLSLAFYTLYATRLLARYSSLIVVGWAMLIAGICMNFIHPIWSVSVADWTMTTVLVLLFTIVFGTAIAFWFFYRIASISACERNDFNWNSRATGCCD